MNIDKLNLELVRATDTFAEDFKEKLNESDLDEKTFNALYDLGADIRHTFDKFHEAIVECLKGN